MNRLLTIFCTAVLTVSAGVAAETKIECDGGFDKKLAGAPGFFNINAKASAESECKLISDPAGGQFLSVKTTAAKSAEFFLFRHIPVTKGKSTVKFSLMIKGKGALTLCNYGYDQAKKYKMYTRLKGKFANIRINTPEWKKYDFEIDAAHIGDDVKFIFLAFVVHKNSELSFDNFSGSVVTAE